MQVETCLMWLELAAANVSLIVAVTNKPGKSIQWEFPSNNTLHDPGWVSSQEHSLGFHP